MMQHRTSTADIEAAATIVDATAKSRDATLRNRTNNRNAAPVPRMPAVEDLSLLGNVDVLLLGCTTTEDLISRWG